ncbi:MAG: hypothetical protein MI743_03080 [Sneathiellales bacterium]|nr:hypothetical protein [Sneathiellales bacterium]
MITFFRNLFLTLISLLALANSAQADVTSITPIPSKVAVSATGGAVNVTWRVVHVVTAGGQVTTQSPSYTILINGNPVQTVNKVLSRTTTVAGGVPETLTFSEVIPVSVSIAKQIALSGNNARIERDFSDGIGRTDTGSATLISGGGASGALEVNRIDLAFENGGKTSVIGQNAELRAVAEISFRSRGLLQAEWRLIDSASIRGGRFERLLSRVRLQLSSAGTGKTRIVSPNLPTGTTGLHEVQLVIVDPSPRFEEPVLRYYVNPTATTSLGRMAPLEAFSPKQGVPFSSATVFDWHPVPGAAAYQIELYNLPGGKNPQSSLKETALIVGPTDTDADLVVGKIVPGDQTSATFAEFSAGHLEHGHVYLWRIRAISSGGTVVGQSDFRKILYP